MANLLTGQDDLSNIAWVKSHATVTTGQADPLGGTAAQLLVEDNTNNVHSASQLITTALVGQSYTGTVTLKANSRSAALVLITDGSGNYYGVNIDLTNGATTVSNSVTLNNVSFSVVLIAAGWYRVFVTANANVTTFGMQVWIENPVNNNSYLGNGSSIFVWDAWLLQSSLQLEMPAPLPVNVKTFDISKNQLITPVGGGFIQTIQRGPDLWVAHYETPPLTIARDQDFQAFIDQLNGSANTFLAFDPRKTKPNNYFTQLIGGEPWSNGGVSPPVVTKADVANSSLNMKGFVVGAVLQKGDMIAFKDANIWRLFRAQAAAIADGSGLITGLKVNPQPTQDIQMAYPAVRLTRACAEMKMIGAPIKDDRVSDVGPTYKFSAIQFINRA